jgi:hypothetical protein
VGCCGPQMWPAAAGSAPSASCFATTSQPTTTCRWLRLRLQLHLCTRSTAPTGPFATRNSRMRRAVLAKLSPSLLGAWLGRGLSPPAACQDSAYAAAAMDGAGVGGSATRPTCGALASTSGRPALSSASAATQHTRSSATQLAEASDRSALHGLWASGSWTAPGSLVSAKPAAHVLAPLTPGFVRTSHSKTAEAAPCKHAHLPLSAQAWLGVGRTGGTTPMSAPPLASRPALPLTATSGSGRPAVAGGGSPQPLFQPWLAAVGQLRGVQTGQLSRQRVPKSAGLNDIIMPNTTQVGTARPLQIDQLAA